MWYTLTIKARRFAISIFFSLLFAVLGVSTCWSADQKSNDGDLRKTDAFISLVLDSTVSPDHFRLHVFDHYFGHPFANKTIIGEGGAGGEYSFKVGNIPRTCYINLTLLNAENKYPFDILQLYLVEQGDRVKIKVTGRLNGRHQLSFSGKGAEKFRCRYEISRIIDSLKPTDRVLDKNGSFIKDNRFDKVWTLVKQKINVYKPKLNSIVYQVLKLDVYASIEVIRLEHLERHHSDLLKTEAVAQKIRKQYEKKDSMQASAYSIQAKIVSANYPRFVLDKLSIGRYKYGNSKRLKDNHINNVLADIKNRSEGELRDRLMTFFALSLSKSKFVDTVLEQVLSSVSTDYCIDELQTFFDSNAAGKEAYSFSLPDTSGRRVSLNELKGKVVFIDFWYNGCLGCAQYYKRVISAAEHEFKNNRNVVFISINIDTDRKRWIDGINAGIYTSVNNINLNTFGKGMDHEIIKNYRVLSFPRPVLIDKEGKIFVNNADKLKDNGSSGLIALIRNALEKQGDKQDLSK